MEPWKEFVTWEGVDMDLSMAAVQDVAARHFQWNYLPRSVTIRVSKNDWDWAREAAASRNKASQIAPLAVQFNLELDEKLQPHSWMIADRDIRVFVKGV